MPGMDIPASALVGQHVDVSYSLEEDRLQVAIRGPSGTCGFWLTRRLCRALLHGMMDFLSRTSEMSSRVTADARDQLLLFEYAEAMSSRVAPEEQVAPTVALQPEAPRLETHLLRKVDVTASAGVIGFSLFADTSCHAFLPLSRANAHQLAGILFSKARQAGWDFDDLPWLEQGSRLVVPTGAASH